MRLLKFFTLVLAASFFSFSNSQAQTIESAGDYLEYIGKANENLSAIYLSYISAIAHNKSARKVEKRRQEVVNAIFETRGNVQGLPPWKGDRAFRDTSVAYLKLLYTVFNEDYGKIVNMEEIAEQSYDAMEAYMLAQEKAYEKLDAAAEKQNEMQKQFAAKYNITLLNNSSKLETKSKIASELTKYYNVVYLIFFKAFKQESYLTEAVNKKNIIAIEQNKNSLERFSNEGLEKLKSIKPYSGDPALVYACRDAMKFFKEEVSQMQVMTDFFMSEENFNKLKKNFESKPAAKRTQPEIDEYNKGVNDFNNAVNRYNDANKQLNKQRTKAIDNWNNTANHFMDDYMPVQRKQ